MSRHHSLLTEQSFDEGAATDQSWIVLTKELVEIWRTESAGVSDMDHEPHGPYDRATTSGKGVV